MITIFISNAVKKEKEKTPDKMICMRTDFEKAFDFSIGCTSTDVSILQ